MDSIPGLGRSPGGGQGNPLQYSCLEIPMDRRTWRAKSMGSQRVGQDWSNLACRHALFSMTWMKVSKLQGNEWGEANRWTTIFLSVRILNNVARVHRFFLLEISSHIDSLMRKRSNREAEEAYAASFELQKPTALFEKLVERTVSLLRSTHMYRNTKVAHRFRRLPHVVGTRYLPMDWPQSAAATVEISVPCLSPFN